MLKKTLMISTLIASLAFAGTVTAKSVFTPEQEKEIKKIVEQTIFDDPQMIERAFQSKHEEMQKAMQTQMKEKVQKNLKDLAQKKGDPFIGNPKGDVTIVKFFDYNCGYCRALSKTMDELVKEDKNLRIVFKEYPVMGGEASDRASRAALAANDQGKYGPFHSKLMETGDYSEDNLLKIGEEVGLNKEKMRHFMNSKKASDMLKENRELAEKIGVPGGIPFCFVGDVFVQGAQPKDNFLTAIREVRAAKKK